jgi:hypothetical protein
MQSVRSNGSLPVALLMMMVGEDIVFCANVMVLQLGFYPIIMCRFGCCWTNNVRTSSVGSLQKVLYKIQKMCTTLVTTRPTLVLFLWTPYRRFFLLSGQRFWVAVLTLQCMCTLKGGFASRDLPVVWNGLTFGRSGWWWLLTLCVFCKKKKKTSYNVSEGRCLPLWMCIEEIEEDLHNQCICSKTKKESIGFM